MAYKFQFKEAKYTHRITVRLDDDLYLKLTELKKNTNSNYTEIIRDLLSQSEVKCRAKKIEKRECDHSKLLYELNKIGNNINQIAKYVNTEKELDTKILEELKKSNEAMQMLIMLQE